MEENTNRTYDIIFQIITLVITIIPIYIMFTTTPKEISTNALIFFGIIIGIVVISAIFLFIYNKYKKMQKDIQNNHHNLKEIKKDLQFKEMFNQMDKRLNIMEKITDKLLLKNKKGVLDPRIVIIIILVILLYFFLKSMGIIR